MSRDTVLELCPSCRAKDNNEYTDANGVKMRACGRCMIQWRVSTPEANESALEDKQPDEKRRRS